MTPASVPSTPGSALGVPSPSGRGRSAAAGSGHATSSACSNEAEATPLLWEAATPRTARARRVGDFLASTASGLALVLVLVALVATTPSQWADAVALGRAAITNPDWPRQVVARGGTPKRPPVTSDELRARALRHC